MDINTKLFNLKTSITTTKSLKKAIETAKEVSKADESSVKTVNSDNKQNNTQETNAKKTANSDNEQNNTQKANSEIVNEGADNRKASAKPKAVKSNTKSNKGSAISEHKSSKIENEFEKIDREEEQQQQHQKLLKQQQDAATAYHRYALNQIGAKNVEFEFISNEHTVSKADDEEIDSKEEDTEEEVDSTKEEANAAAIEEEPGTEAGDVNATEKTEDVGLPVEIHQLTEEEAIAQGYIIIKSPEDLQAIANNLNGKYILMCDLDMSGFDWQSIGGYDPSLKDPFENAFSGIFNGNGYKISNLSVKVDENGTCAGLFGATNGAEISNVILENIRVDAPTDYNKIAVGGLIGRSRNTNIDNVNLSGNISGHQGVGGLIGVENDSAEWGKVSITNVNVNVNINASFYSGGLIGSVLGNENNSLYLDNCNTNGNLNITDQDAGGLIGKAGKCVITVNHCSSSMNITKETLEEDIGLSWLLDGASHIGGIIGNCDGTFISICNSKFYGSLNCEDEFKGENYGWYMNDAQVSIFELSAGLPADDILNIEGIEGILPVIDSKTGAVYYEITVSTLAGMNRMVDMIQSNPKLAEILRFNIQFDFETMDLNYDHSLYSQYGVVQILTEKEDGTVVNNVYIDNEIDLQTTFHVNYYKPKIVPCKEKKAPEKTMVEGLYKYQGKYYILTPGHDSPEFKNFTEVSLDFFYQNQETLVKKRLDSDEVRLRNKLVSKAQTYQSRIHDILRERYGIPENVPLPLIDAAEYKYLKIKAKKGQELTQEEKLKLEFFEVNYTIMNIVARITKNEGCAMGGNASFLDKDKGVPLEDEYGQIRWMTADGLELRQKTDENGELMYNEDGIPLFVTLEGEDYDGKHGDAYIVRGYPVLDENGNMLYSDAEGNTLTEVKDEDGNVTYTYEDGTVYEGNVDELTKQLQEYTPEEVVTDIDIELDDLLQTYENGGSVEV